MELVFPQVITIAYQRLLRDVEEIEAVSYESETLERLVYQMNIRRMHDSAYEQVKLFNAIVNGINRVGLAELHPDVTTGTDEISIEAFMEYVADQLEIEIPAAYRAPLDFSRFVQHRILGFKTHNVDLDQDLEQVDQEIDD